MPVHPRPISVKHELTLPDEVVKKSPMIRDMLAAAQVL